MTQLLRRQLDGLDEHIAKRADAVSVEAADAHPRHAQRIAAAKAAVDFARDALDAGATGMGYEKRKANAEFGLANARGESSLDIAKHGAPVAREMPPIEVMKGSGGTANSNDQDAQDAIAGVQFMRRLRGNLNDEGDQL